MTRWCTFSLALMTVAVVSVATVAVASAESTPLPIIQTSLPGELYPINLGEHLEAKDELVDEAGGVLTAKEQSLLLNVAESTSLGKATIEYLGVEEQEKHKCHTEGDSEANGAILIPNAEWHLVYTGLSPENALETGALILFTKFTILCNASLFEIILTGPETQRMTYDADGGLIHVVDICGYPASGLQEIPAYYNSSSELIPTTLLVNPSGTGNKKACEQTEGTGLLATETGSAASMFSVLF